MTESTTAAQAIALADWHCRYALDRLADDPRQFHPGVRSHLTSGSVQLLAAAELTKPKHDQVPLT